MQKPVGISYPTPPPRNFEQNPKFKVFVFLEASPYFALLPQ